MSETNKRTYCAPLKVRDTWVKLYCAAIKSGAHLELCRDMANTGVLHYTERFIIEPEKNGSGTNESNGRISKENKNEGFDEEGTNA